MEHIKGILSNGIMITAFVLVMMLLIEFINVYSNGRFENFLQKHKHLQIVISALMGAIPGCLGTYTAVSLFTHNIISKGAMVATLIATSGDEAFFMLSLIPKETIIITAVTFIVAITAGYMTNVFAKNRYYSSSHQLHIHRSADQTKIFDLKQIKYNFTHLSLQRAILLTGLVLFLYGLATGIFTHAHATGLGESCQHEHIHENHNHGTSMGWVELTMFITACISLACLTVANEHFLEEHLWEHIIKKHAIKTFAWTILALSLIEVFNIYFTAFNISQYQGLIILVIAVIIGIIPESGPHLIFISLYASGHIPMSVLIANSIVQDGHGALPLFAESKRSFLSLKSINVIAGLVVGVSLWMAGF